MGLARSTYYDLPQAQPIGAARLVEQIKAICADWPAYGYRRVTSELHEQGHVVNHKKVMRLMKENGLSVRARRRFMVTTDSNHDGPIFPNLAKDIMPTGVNQLWVADITYLPRTLPPLCLASSKTYTTPSAAIRRSDTRAPLCLNRSTPGRGQFDRLPPVHPKGCTPLAAFRMMIVIEKNGKTASLRCHEDEDQTSP